MSRPTIDLKDLVVSVRKSLESTDTEMRLAKKDPLFELESLELELKFTVEEAVGGKSGFDLKIVSLSGQTDVRSEQVQTLKVKYVVAQGAKAKGVVGTRAHSAAEGQEQKDVPPL